MAIYKIYTKNNFSIPKIFNFFNSFFLLVPDGITYFIKDDNIEKLIKYGYIVNLKNKEIFPFYQLNNIERLEKISNEEFLLYAYKVYDNFDFINNLANSIKETRDFKYILAVNEFFKNLISYNKEKIKYNKDFLKIDHDNYLYKNKNEESQKKIILTIKCNGYHTMLTEGLLIIEGMYFQGDTRKLEEYEKIFSNFLEKETSKDKIRKLICDRLKKNDIDIWLPKAMALYPYLKNKEGD